MDAEYDLAQALIDLSLGPAEPVTRLEATSHATESALRETLNGATTVPDVLAKQDSLHTPIKSIIPAQEHESLTENSRPVEIKQPSLVLLQPLCDHHKFARNVRQRELDSIVERPERSRAAMLGILLAKSWLQTILPAESAFDIRSSVRKGWLGDPAVEAIHGYDYPQELLKLCENAAAALQTHKLEIPEHYPWGDLYLGARSIEAIHGCLGALYDGIDAMYLEQYDRVHICIRPPGHHAAEISPCGFCWINNVHIALEYARSTYNIKRAVILDFDLHHGDGSQSIAWTLNERLPNCIAYYSLHDIYSYPCEAGNVDKIREASVTISAHGHNVHNVHLKPFKSQAEFDDLYNQSYSTLLSKAEEYLRDSVAAGEEALICISAGYDASEHEINTMQRHNVSVPTSFYERFTSDAVKLATKYTKGKIFSVMEGGYGDRAISSAACSHVLGLVRDTKNELSARACYSLDNLKMIEKVFPPKNRPVRRPTGSELKERPWLEPMLHLHEQYLADTKSATAKPEALLDSLGKMTLRERRSVPATPVAAPQPKPARRTPRATPSRAKVNKFPAAPPLPIAIQHNLTEDLAEAANVPLPITPQANAPVYFEAAQVETPTSSIYQPNILPVLDSHAATASKAQDLS